MATYNLIASGTVTSGQLAFTFSAIPSTYSDLLIKCSLRHNTGSAQTIGGITINATTGTFRSVFGTNTAGGSDANTYGTVPSTQTANTFGNVEIYIPNYTGAFNKSFSQDGVNESTSATAASVSAAACVAAITATVTSVTITSNASAGYATGSNFYLYGISKS